MELDIGWGQISLKLEYKTKLLDQSWQISSKFCRTLVKDFRLRLVFAKNGFAHSYIPAADVRQEGSLLTPSVGSTGGVPFSCKKHRYLMLPLFDTYVLYLVYTRKHTRSIHEANVFKIHVHDVSSKFASCLLHRVNGVLRRVQSKVTKLNWHGLVIDELTNGQAVMHYSRHRLTASVNHVADCAQVRVSQWSVSLRSVFQTFNPVSSV